MREIKFRFWDKKRKYMYEVASLHFTRNKVMSHIKPGLGGHVRDLDSNDIILMQYTGLKDKNGKEIYEGDIVKSTMHYGDDFGNPVGEAEGQIIEVKWLEKKGEQMVGFSFFPCDDMYDLEVIGNIYENPELLK